MRYNIRIYIISSDAKILRRIKERFNTIVSVNGESYIEADEIGKNLLLETERRGTIKIRGIKEISV